METILIAGATGAIGARLASNLVRRGHTVIGLFQRERNARVLVELGAVPVQADVRDKDAVMRAFRAYCPTITINQATRLPRAIRPWKIRSDFAENDRVRVEGSANLVAAALECGTRRIVTQSVAFAYAPKRGLACEHDRLYLDAPEPWRHSVEAIRQLEYVTVTSGLSALVLRYGYLYGPGTQFASDGALAAAVRARTMPIIGKGAGVHSFIHIDDAVNATAENALNDSMGIYNIVDDEPAPLREWLPAFARSLGAKRPIQVPAFLAPAFGPYIDFFMNSSVGASNQTARTQLGMSLRHETWRRAFA